MPIVFEWNERKDRANRKKHGVSFSEAALIFADPLAKIFPDEDHSVDEYREIIIGHSPANRLLVISFTESATDVVRIISARRATKREQQDYEENR
jgi:uncharacterized DUF497 family protein